MITQEAKDHEGLEIVFFDGHCALCHGFVEFLIKSVRELPGNFRFAPLQGETFRHLSDKDPALARFKNVDSVIFYVVGKGEEASRAWVKSGAVSHVMERLGGLHTLTGRALRMVPRFIRDVGYDQVAAVRHKIFGKKEELCPMPQPEHAFRFLP